MFNVLEFGDAINMEKMLMILVSLSLSFVLLLSIGCASDQDDIVIELNSSKNNNLDINTKTSDHSGSIKGKVETESEAKAKNVIVIDALGNEIEFGAIPNKIATISPTATEMLYAVGGVSVLRDRASKYPAEVKELPNVGSAYDPSIEDIVKVKPDLVIIEALTQARFIPVLAQSGFKVMAVKAETKYDITTNILNIGKVIGKESEAINKILEIDNRLGEIGSEDGRTVLILISDQDRNLYAARPESYTGLIAQTIGMVNKAAGLPDAGPYPGFTLMSPEAILMADPDVIITLSPAPSPAPRLSNMVAQMPPFAGLKAIQTGSILEADVDLFLHSPGPRIVEAVEFLKEGLESSKK